MLVATTAMMVTNLQLTRTKSATVLQPHALQCKHTVRDSSQATHCAVGTHVSKAKLWTCVEDKALNAVIA